MTGRFLLGSLLALGLVSFADARGPMGLQQFGLKGSERVGNTLADQAGQRVSVGMQLLPQANQAQQRANYIETMRELQMRALQAQRTLQKKSSTSPTHVRPYVKKDGTFVRGHYRSNPDESFHNNWSTYPNVNPYTLKKGTRRYPSYQRK